MIRVTSKSGARYTITAGVSVSLASGLLVVRDEDEAVLAWFLATDISVAWKDDAVALEPAPPTNPYPGVTPLKRGKGFE